MAQSAKMAKSTIKTVMSLKGPEPQDFAVSGLAALAVAAYHMSSLHWIWTLCLCAPLFFGFLPKLRVISEVGRREREKREKRRENEPKGSAPAILKSPAFQAIKGSMDAARRLNGLVVPPLDMSMLKSLSFKGLQANQDPPRSVIGSEPSSPQSATSPILSPQGIERRFMEKLHFNGNRHDFFASTKFAGCLREDECDELFKLCKWISLRAGEVVFSKGDSVDSGLHMVVEGTLGVYVREDDDIVDGEDGAETQRYSLHYGESIGDLDLLYSSKTRVNTVKAETPALVMQLSQEAFRRFCARHPDALLLFLRLAIGRLHRVAFFTLGEFLGIPEYLGPQQDAVVFEPESSIPNLFQSDGVFASTVTTIQETTTLYYPETQAKDFYVLLSGTVQLTATSHDASASARQGTMMAVNQPCIFGARSFWTAVDRKDSACVSAGSKIACLNEATMITMASEAPDDLVDFILAAAEGLFPLIRDFISIGLSRRWVQAREAVFVENQEADGLYILITGRVKLKSAGSNIETEIGRGDMIGEESFLDAGIEQQFNTCNVRKSTAICMRDCELVKMSANNFELICKKYPKVALKLVQSIARRRIARQGRGASVAEQGERVAGQSKTSNLATIAVIPLNPESEVSCDGFVQMLQQQLMHFGSVLYLDEDIIGEKLGTDTKQNLHKYFYRTRVATWIVQQEEERRFIILKGSHDGSSWSELCVSQSDCILLVAAHASLPSILPAEQRLIWSTGDGQTDSILDVRRELVLLHTGGENDVNPAPNLTKLWLDLRPGVTLHHHLRTGTQLDVQRLGRHLAGRAVGLVLGGGGARGLAHLGVLQAMEELNIPVDFIGGTSQGAYMAALYAQQLHSSRMNQGVDQLADGIGSILALMRDITLPVLSMFSGKSFSHTIRNSLGTGDIRDTWINFFCVSCSLNSSRPEDAVHVHKSGTIWKYVRASMTVVGYLPPIWDHGELLVDGGYVNNLPSDEMVKMGVHTIIGVDVEDKEDMFKNLIPLDDHVSGWAVLWHQVLEFFGLSGRWRVPRHKDITTALCYITHTTQFPRAQAMLDLKLSPPVPDIALLDYHKKAEIIERGKKHALELLKPWVESRDKAERAELEERLGMTRSVSMPMMGPAIREAKISWDQVVTSSFGAPKGESTRQARDSQDLLAETFKRTPRLRNSANFATQATFFKEIVRKTKEEKRQNRALGRSASKEVMDHLDEQEMESSSTGDDEDGSPMRVTKTESGGVVV